MSAQLGLGTELFLTMRALVPGHREYERKKERKVIPGLPRSTQPHPTSLSTIKKVGKKRKKVHTLSPPSQLFSTLHNSVAFTYGVLGILVFREVVLLARMESDESVLLMLLPRLLLVLEDSLPPCLSNEQ